MTIKLPKQYEDLINRYQTPLAREALKLFGTTEFVGNSHNPVILGWADEISETLDKFYNKDEIPWCGLFMGICAKRAGYLPPSGFETLRARSWAKWGDPIHGDPVLWDVLVFERSGGGHVGIYVGEDTGKCYHVLGGNQGDKVSIVRIAKDRLLTARREPLNSNVKAKVRLWRDSKGSVSQNES